MGSAIGSSDANSGASDESDGQDSPMRRTVVGLRLVFVGILAAINRSA